MSSRFTVKQVVGGVCGLVLVAGCCGGGAFVWTNVIAEYNDLPACPAHLEADSSAEDPFTAFRDNGEHTTPELDEPLIVAGRTLTTYASLAWQPDDDHAYAQQDNTRVISTSGAYISIPVPEVASISVSPDRRTAAVLPYEYEQDPDTEEPHDDQIGLMDLTTADMTWIDLPGDPIDAAWSPTARVVLIATDAADSVMLLDPDTGEVETIPLPTPDDTRRLLDIHWMPDGEQFIANVSTGNPQITATVHERNGDVVQSIDTTTSFQGFSPSGDRYLEGDEVVDLETGDVHTNAGLTGCSVHGNVHSFSFQAWTDDDHMLVIQEESMWPDDRRPGEPSEEPRGSRLVIVDLEGHVTEIITDWRDPLPDSLTFAPA